MTTRVRGTVGVALFAASLSACSPGAPKHGTAGPGRSSAEAPRDAGAEAASAEAPIASLDELTARGRMHAPLMREVARVADAKRPTELALAHADGCLRAAFAASRPARAWFEDAARAPRGEIAVSGSSGVSGTFGSSVTEITLVPPHGPACGRKGEVLRLLVVPEGAEAVARAVVWQAP